MVVQPLSLYQLANGKKAQQNPLPEAQSEFTFRESLKFGDLKHSWASDIKILDTGRVKRRVLTEISDTRGVIDSLL